MSASSKPEGFNYFFLRRRKYSVGEILFQGPPRYDHADQAPDHERHEAHRAQSAYHCAGHVSHGVAAICSSVGKPPVQMRHSEP